MSRYERYGVRSLVYSKWHRFYLGDAEPMIDLDGVEYCAERGCSKPLVLIETARDVGQASKATTVMRELAKQAGGIMALCVLYKIAEGVDPEKGCACEARQVDDDCSHGISRFRVRKAWPSPSPLWVILTPEEFRDRLRTVRMHHIAAEHVAWESA